MMVFNSFMATATRARDLTEADVQADNPADISGLAACFAGCCIVLLTARQLQQFKKSRTAIEYSKSGNFNGVII